MDLYRPGIAEHRVGFAVFKPTFNCILSAKYINLIDCKIYESYSVTDNATD